VVVRAGARLTRQVESAKDADAAPFRALAVGPFPQDETDGV